VESESQKDSMFGSLKKINIADLRGHEDRNL
jgi:hypothetical protein